MDESKIRKLAVVNAVEHDGRAEVNSVLGKIISENPESKKEIKTLIPKIKQVVDEVNAMTKDDQEKILADLGGAEKKEKLVEEQGLPELPGAVMRRVVTAFPPEPSKYPHIGHAKAALINFEYAQKYRGKFVLRFEDSNPEKAKKEFYDAMIDGLTWLGLKWNSVDYLSDHLPQYYKEAEKLIRKGKAYVCTCDQETVKKLRSEGMGCEHRESSPKQNMDLWREMLKVMKPGSATLRMKIDMAHQNTTMRDPSIFRIILGNHPRAKKKYRVWPMYDFGTAMLDAWEKITHRVRSKELELRKELQDHILKTLGHKVPFITEIGRFDVKGAVTQGREIREIVEKSKFGWDDPRLVTLVALRRRGFVPEAIREFVLSTGVTKAESEYEWQVIESFNRKAVDPIADRYFGVMDPEEVSVEGVAHIKSVIVQTRPGSEKRREIPIESGKFYVEKEDAKNAVGQRVGLMFLGTVNFGSVTRFVASEVEQETPKIHWVGEPNVPIKIVMPDGSVKSGIGETALRKLKPGSIIQLYRVGFCRVDRVDKSGKEVALYFAHK
jgi:glutamyl-tRNA synthetase